MLFSLLYFLVRRLLGAGGGRAEERDIELLVLRHQLKVLQRQVTRPRLNRLDRVLLAAASRRLTKSSWSARGRDQTGTPPQQPGPHHQTRKQGERSGQQVGKGEENPPSTRPASNAVLGRMCPTSPLLRVLRACA